MKDIRRRDAKDFGGHLRSHQFYLPVDVAYHLGMLRTLIVFAYLLYRAGDSQENSFLRKFIQKCHNPGYRFFRV